MAVGQVGTRWLWVGPCPWPPPWEAVGPPPVCGVGAQGCSNSSWPSHQLQRARREWLAAGWAGLAKAGCREQLLGYPGVTEAMAAWVDTDTPDAACTKALCTDNNFATCNPASGTTPKENMVRTGRRRASSSRHRSSSALCTAYSRNRGVQENLETGTPGEVFTHTLGLAQRTLLADAPTRLPARRLRCWCFRTSSTRRGAALRPRTETPSGLPWTCTTTPPGMRRSTSPARSPRAVSAQVALFRMGEGCGGGQQWAVKGIAGAGCRSCEGAPVRTAGREGGRRVKSSAGWRRRAAALGQPTVVWLRKHPAPAPPLRRWFCCDHH